MQATKKEIAGGEKPKLLVVDDEGVVRELFDVFFTKQGYEVFSAIDGFDAFEKIKRNKFDILILDLKMPKMDGMEFLGKIRNLKDDLAIIIITGYATIDTAKEAMKQGCFDYITKPFDLEEVSIIIKRALELRRITDERKKLKEQLQIAERLASLAQMGAGVVHEVNTVLTSIKLFLEMLKAKLPETQKEFKNIGVILEEIERAEKLIARFFKFTKPEKAEFLKVDLNKLIKHSLHFFEYRLKKNNIEVITDLSKEIVEVVSDPIQIEEVLSNLVHNSIDAMPQGGQLTISSKLEGKNAVMIVSDAGIGIPPENIERVFNPFFTTKPHGTGLGLAIVYRIIEEHKGTIKISSEKGKGTSARVELPIS
jgi:signal transduction histidine kinase